MFNYIQAVSEQIPKMNRHLLIELDKQQLNQAASFIENCFKWATEHLTDGSLKYKGYVIVGPHERVAFDLFGPKIAKTQSLAKAIPKKGACISAHTSELQLLKYIFEFNNELMYCYLYVPYIHNHMLSINGKQYALQRSIVEKLFSRITNRACDGIMIRPIRARLSFYRHDYYILTTHDGRYVSRETIVRTILHHKSHGRRARETTIINYLLAKFGFVGTIAKFGFTVDDLCFVESVPEEILKSKYDYFLAIDTKNPNTKTIYLRANSEKYNDGVFTKLIANMLYIFTYFNIQTLDNLMSTEGTIFKVMLGLIIDPTSNLIKAKADMDTHLISVSSFIDPLSKKRFNSFGLPIDDIYGLLEYVFIEIDSIVSNCHTQNLYEKRFDLTDGILIKAYAETIFRNFYGRNQKDVLQYTTALRILRIDALKVLKKIYAPKQTATINVTPAPQIYNDNALLPCLATKTRHISNTEQGFHPSIMVAESLHTFHGKDIGKNGAVNVYVPIDPENGNILHPEYAYELDKQFNM